MKNYWCKNQLNLYPQKAHVHKLKISCYAEQELTSGLILNHKPITKANTGCF